MRRLLLVGLAVVAIAAALPASATTIQSITSPGGIKAWLVEDHSLPVISLSFNFKGGAALDPDGKGGLANFVSDTLDEGAGDLDSQAYQGKLRDLGIGIGFNVGEDAFGGQLRTVTDNRDTAFSMLGLALTKPRFDQDAVDRVKKQELVGITSELDDPDTIAGQALNKTLFPDHPYGRPAEGTLDSVAKLTRDDLVGWVQHHLGRDHLTVSVVGDITPEQLGIVLDSTFGALPATSDNPDAPDVQPAGAGLTQVIHHAIPQSIAIFAEPGLKRNDPDWYGAFILNYILGGGDFSSRLTEEVRLKRGLAYSVYSSLAPRDHAALIGGGVGTRNDRMKDSLDVVHQVWQDLADKGVSDEEVAAAKTYLNGSFPLQMGSTMAMAQLLTTMQTEHLGIDYLDRREDIINGVTVADVNRLAKRLLDAKALTTVVVGDPKGM